MLKNFIKKYWPLCLTLLVSLTPIIWFLGKSGFLINGIDTNFPLNPLIWFQRRFFVWNDTLNAGGDFSSSLSGIFFHFVQVLPFLAGLNLQLVEIISFIFWFSLITFSSYLFVRSIVPGSRLAQITFVIFYVFNIYMFNSWENVKVSNLSLVAAIPLGLFTLVKLAKKEIPYLKGALYAVLTGIVLSGSGINPAYFICFFMIVTIFVLSQMAIDPKSFKLRISEFFLFSFFVVLVNSFWIVPTTNFIFRNITSSHSIGDIGFTNWVDSLSQNTSLINVARLQGAWDWYSVDDVSGMPLYIPYSVRYFTNFPFIAFSFLILSLVLLSFMVRNSKKKYLYISFSIMVILGIFFGAGTHAPTGSIFKFLITKLPFFSLFRSPWYIFTPLLTLAYAGLIALLVETLAEKFDKKKLLISFMVFALVIGNVVYSYPLVLGRIFRPGRNDSFYVKFPDYVFDAGKWVNQSVSGRIAGYPDDEIEQFSWGYRGIESILSLLTNKEIIFSPLNNVNTPISETIRQFYASIKRGQIEKAEILGDKLSLEYIFEKGDESSLAVPLSDEIRSRPKESFGSWNFYKFTEFPSQKIFSAENIFFMHPYSDSSKLLALTGSDGIGINPIDSVASSALLRDRAGSIILSQNSQASDYSAFMLNSYTSNRVLKRNISEVRYDFEIPKSGSFTPTLEKYKVEAFGISTDVSLNVSFDGVSQVWPIDHSNDSYIYFKPVLISEGKHSVKITLENNNLMENRLKTGNFSKEGDADFSIVEDAVGTYLNIFNTDDQDAMAIFKVESFDPFIPYLIEGSYKQVYGNNGAVLMRQQRQATMIKAQTERLPNYPDWQPFSLFYSPVETNSDLSFSLVSPQTKDVLGTTINYRDFSVKPVFLNNLSFIEVVDSGFSKPNVTYIKKSPVLYEVKVEGATAPHIIVFSENYSPNWEASIPGRHFTANYYANGWYMENTTENYSFNIYYKAQNNYKIGIIISVITVLASFVLFALSRRRDK